MDDEFEKMENPGHIDDVNHPPHYAPIFGMRSPECNDFTSLMLFNRACAFKYVWRAGTKDGKIGGLKDLRKALWYLEHNPPYREPEILTFAVARLFQQIEPPTQDEELLRKWVVLGEIVTEEYADAVRHIKEWIEDWERNNVCVH